MNELLLVCFLTSFMVIVSTIGSASLPRIFKFQILTQNQGIEQIYKYYLKLGTIFSGGVMLAMGMVQLLGDAVTIPEGGETSDTLLGYKFPLTTFLTALGALTLLTMDVISVAVQKKAGNSQLQSVTTEGVELTPQQKSQNSSYNHNDGRINGSSSDKNTNLGSGGSELQTVKLEDGEKLSPRDESDGNSKQQQQYNQIEDNNNHNQSNGMSEIQKAESQQQVQHLKVTDKKETNIDFNGSMLPNEVTLAGSIALAVALFIHSLIQGAALGAEEHTYKLQNNFFALVLNQSFSTFALGITLLQCKPSPFLYWLIISPVILSESIGLFIGYGQGQGLGGKGGFALNALTAGPFLYVAVVLLIPREQDTGNGKREKAWQLVFLWLGFFVSSLLTVWT